MPKAAAAAAQEPGARRQHDGICARRGRDGRRQPGRWEIKSVNGKALDLRLRLPPGYDALELPLRALLGERLRRGSVSANLDIIRQASGSEPAGQPRGAGAGAGSRPRAGNAMSGRRRPARTGSLRSRACWRAARTTCLTRRCAAGARRRCSPAAGAPSTSSAPCVVPRGRALPPCSASVSTRSRSWWSLPSAPPPLQPDAVRARLRSLVDALEGRGAGDRRGAACPGSRAAGCQGRRPRGAGSARRPYRRRARAAWRRAR